MLITLFKKSFILLIIFSISFSSEVDISADELIYKENHLIIASGNVELSYQNIKLNSKYAEIDTKTNEFFALGGIDVVYEGNRFYTDVVTYKLKEDKLVFSAVSATFNPVELQAPVYFTSKTISKDNIYFQGNDATLSTCPYDRQYYLIEAKRFKFYPNDKIIGYDVYCKSGPVPVFYSPYYEFKLGYANPILLFPIIGTNLVEGDYVKTALDYYLNEDFKTLIYIDHMQKLGWGFGFSATIRKNKFDPSTAYLYFIDSNHYALKWDQTINFPDENIKYGIQQRNMHRRSGGFEKFTDGYIGYSNKQIGSLYAYNYDNREYAQKTEKYSWQGSIGDSKNNVQYAKDTYSNSGALRQNFSINTSIKTVNNNFNYSANKSGNNDYQYYNNALSFSPVRDLQVNTNITYKNDKVNSETDELLQPKIGLTYSLFNAPLNLRAVALRTDMLFDLDGDRVTKDNNLSILENIPEAELSFNPYTSGIFRYSPSIIVGNYHERRYIDPTYGTNGNRDITLKRILVRNDINADIYKSEYMQFGATYGYDQYLYETQDKQYGLNETYQLDVFNGNPFRNSLRYTQYHNGGYSPFYFDEMSSYVNKRLNNSFIYQVTDKTTFTVRDGFDFINNKRDIEYFDLKHSLDTKSSVSLFTGYDHENSRWQNLQSNAIYQQDYDNYLIWRMNYELVSGIVRDSRIQVGKSFGEEEPWKVRSEFVWNNFNKQYTVPFVDIIRNMGCVELIYRYREYNHEHSFLFRVNAFPDQTFGTTVGDAGSTFHGWEQQDVAR